MIEVRVPATSANLCVGFDSLGLAVDWWAKFYFEPSDSLSITGCPKEYANKENLVVLSFLETCRHIGKELPAFHLHIESDIPFSRGLGSSSTCVVAGILACDAWFGQGLNKMEMLEIATKIEGHPDNVAPCIFGNAVCSFMEQGHPRMMVIPCADYKGLVIIPDYPIQTQEARKVLPDMLPFQSAVNQVGRALCFVQALQTGNEMILAKACDDVLHEPYRKKLIKDYEAIHQKCEKLKLAMWISGSGSTMMAVSLDPEKLKELQRFVETSLRLACKEVMISKKGAWVNHE